MNFVSLSRWRQLAHAKSAVKRRQNTVLYPGIVSEIRFAKMPLQRLPSFVVEDSEPEREALRESILKNKKRLTKRPAARNRPVNTEMEVIDLSSSDESSSQVCPTRPLGIVDLSDSSFDAATSIRKPMVAVRSLPLKDTSIPARSSSADTGQSLSHDAPTHNKFSKFSYVAPPHHRTTANLKKSDIPKQPEAQANRTRQTKKVQHRFADEFPDRQLEKLAKCVSCNLKWTTKKTGAQKMTHVIACASKNSLNDETIRLLIREELDSVSAAGSSGTTGTSEVNQETDTYLDDVLKVIGPKKRGRRQKAKETVQEINTESRHLILNRARLIIGPDKPNEIVESLDSPLVADEDSSNPFPTQNFGQSSLAQRYGGSKLAFSSDLSQQMASTSLDTEDIESEAPPSTQPFAPSKITRRMGTTSLAQAPAGELSDPYDSDPTCVSQCHERDSGFLQSNSKFPENSRAFEFVPSTPSPNLTERDHEDDLETRLEADDCFLHYDPGMASSSENNMPIIPDYDATTRGRPKSPKPAKLASKARVSPKKKVKAKKSKGKKRASGSGSDLEAEREAWEKMMRDKILGDEDLYCRIIRYEPIPLNAFLDLAGIVPPCPTKTRNKLKNFLDQQAIHFYDSVTKPLTKPRRRRRKSRSKSS